MKAVVAIALLGLSLLTPACGGNERREKKDDTCSEARDMAQVIREAADLDGIDSDGICSLSEEEIRAVIDAAPAVPPDEKADRAGQYERACALYRESAANCDDLETDGGVG